MESKATQPNSALSFALYHLACHTSLGTSANTPWLLDSGASHHVISDQRNISPHSPYNVNDTIMIGDGTGLPITHTGSTSHHSSSYTFNLNNVLYVPSMKKNLISVSQFCHNNNVSIEFLPNSFVVKDLRMGACLLQGRTKDDVYEWPVTSSSNAPLLAFS